MGRHCVDPPLSMEDIAYLETMYSGQAHALRIMCKRLQTEQLSENKREHLRELIHRQKLTMKSTRSQINGEII